MAVVCDASPLNFLVRMGLEGVLPGLFGTITLPTQVADELRHRSTPEVVKRFVATPPEWLVIAEPRIVVEHLGLHAGEAAAIALAIELGAELVLLDDLAARRRATAAGLGVAGLLGVLERADARGLIRLPEAVPRLPTDYRIDPAIVAAALRRAAARTPER